MFSVRKRMRLRQRERETSVAEGAQRKIYGSGDDERGLKFFISFSRWGYKYVSISHVASSLPVKIRSDR